MYRQDYHNYSGGGYQVHKERSGCLWIMLVLGTLSCALSLFQGCGLPSVQQAEMYQAVFGDIKPWYWFGIGFLNFLTLVGLAGLWMWRKWGWYIIVIAYTLTFLLALAAQLHMALIISSFITCGIILLVWWVVLSSHWDSFE
jgi:hypothetical protein